MATEPREGGAQAVGAGHVAIALWIAFFSMGFLFKNFFFLQIEIHPFSIFTFYFMSLFCLFNYTSRACSYLCADIV